MSPQGAELASAAIRYVRRSMPVEQHTSEVIDKADTQSAAASNSTYCIVVIMTMMAFQAISIPADDPSMDDAAFRAELAAVGRKRVKARRISEDVTARTKVLIAEGLERGLGVRELATLLRVSAPTIRDHMPVDPRRRRARALTDG